MRELQFCETCPASPRLRDRMQSHIDVYAEDYIQSGEFLLGKYLIIAPEDMDKLRASDQDRQLQQSWQTYEKATRNVSLSLIYLSQIEAGLDYVNGIECQPVESSGECPRILSALYIMGAVRKAMLADMLDS